MCVCVVWVGKNQISLVNQIYFSMGGRKIGSGQIGQVFVNPARMLAGMHEPIKANYPRGQASRVM